MRKLIFLAFLLISSNANSQSKIDWDEKYQLQFSDFQSPATQIGNGNTYVLYAASGIEFSFYMSSGEFMFTKNFNSKVSCTLQREASSLVAPDSAIAFDLLNFSRYQFDLAELYARKLRKRIFEEKDAFSNASFFKPLYDETQKELVERNTLAGTETDLGRNGEKLKELHKAVLTEIESLADFCKTCKPPKKTKK